MLLFLDIGSYFYILFKVQELYNSEKVLLKEEMVEGKIAQISRAS